ncbi:MAG: hypothetical protein AUG51_14115 [Acidobacteria bacterium 13_1_20CM_3_53_8]|nr:MAG: hypothetical protein AUG51_14115 [Acidobacteria bacterium 13_1_20CM_3_53_8]
MDVLRLAREPDVCDGATMSGSDSLVVRARRGDEDAFRMIFERYARPLLAFIYDMVGERALAEELTQETFVRAYKNLSALRDERRFGVWLFGIAKNVARESLRSHPRRERETLIDDERVLAMSDNQPSPAGILLDKELQRVMRAALQSLDEDKRLVFILKIFHHKSYDEIAAITGFTIAKLKTDLHRARAEMRRRIRPYLEAGHEV